MPQNVKVRPWCAKVCWPNRKPFLVGTFAIEEKTLSQEQIRELVIEKYLQTMGEILPLEVPPPDIIHLIPGAIFFSPSEEPEDA
jgi:hypothetical protein